MSTALLAPEATTTGIRITTTFIEAHPQPGGAPGEQPQVDLDLEEIHRTSPAYQFFGRRVRAFSYDT